MRKATSLVWAWQCQWSEKILRLLVHGGLRAAEMACWLARPLAFWLPACMLVRDGLLACTPACILVARLHVGPLAFWLLPDACCCCEACMLACMLVAFMCFCMSAVRLHVCLANLHCLLRSDSTKRPRKLSSTSIASGKRPTTSPRHSSRNSVLGESAYERRRLKALNPPLLQNLHVTLRNDEHQTSAAALSSRTSLLAARILALAITLLMALIRFASSCCLFDALLQQTTTPSALPWLLPLKSTSVALHSQSGV